MIRAEDLKRAGLAAVLSLAMPQGPAAADAALDAALYDIGRAEAQAAGLSPKRMAAVVRVTRMVEAARERLAASADVGTAAHRSAEARLAQLEAQLEQIRAAAAAPPPPTPSPAVAPPAAKAPPPPSPTDGLPAADLARLQSIDRRANAGWQQLQALAPTDWQRSGIVERWRAEVAMLKGQMAGLAAPEHPISREVGKKVSTIDLYVEHQIASAAEVSAALGDVVGRIQTIETWLRDTRIPRPSGALTAPDVDANAARLAEIEQQAAAHLEWVRDVRGRSAAMLESQANALTSRLEHLLSDQIVRARTDLLERLLRDAEKADWRISQIPGLDPANPSDRANRLLGDGGALAEADLAAALGALDLAERYADAAGLAPPETAPRRAKILSAQAMLAEKQHAALGDVRFPKVRSSDPDLIAAAGSALERSAVEMGEVLRLEITYDVQRKAETEGEIHHGAVSSTVTVSRYVWDEFGVTTAERADGKIHLYTHLFAFYHEGGSDVPTGRWVLKERRKLSRILEANVKG